MTAVHRHELWVNHQHPSWNPVQGRSRSSPLLAWQHDADSFHGIRARRAAPDELAPLVLHLHSQPLHPAAAQTPYRQAPAAAADTRAAPAEDPCVDAPLAAAETDVADADESAAAPGASGGPGRLTSDADAPLMLANLRESMQVCVSESGHSQAVVSLCN